MKIIKDYDLLRISLHLNFFKYYKYIHGNIAHLNKAKWIVMTQSDVNNKLSFDITITNF